MNILINHCWCSDSNWGGIYGCRVILTIDAYEGKYSLDWNALLEEYQHEVKQSEVVLKSYIDEAFRLKPEVIQWLNENVKDRPLKKWEIERGEVTRGWAVGTDDYNYENLTGFNLFFERVTDAMKFIERWSVYKKPIQYFNYFKNIRRELDPKTGRLKRVSEWSE